MNNERDSSHIVIDDEGGVNPVKANMSFKEMFGNFGYNLEFYGRASYRKFGNQYIIKINGEVVQKTTINTYDIGISVAALETKLSLPSNIRYDNSFLIPYKTYGMNPTIYSGYGFGMMLCQSPSREHVLTPGRYWNTDGDIGFWESTNAIYDIGTVWDIEIWAHSD